MGLLFYLVMGIFCVSLLKSKKMDFKVKKGIVFTLILFCVVLKAIIAYQTTGYINDINTFKYWGNYVRTQGFSNVYHTDIFLDYPPGYLYILAFLDWLRELFQLSFDSSFYTLMIKLPAIVAEGITALFLYRLSKNNWSESKALGFSLLYCLNPMMIMNSSVWGQVDSVYVMILVVSVYLLMNKKTSIACFLYGLAILCKPQAILFGPIFLFTLLFWQGWKKVLRGLVVGAFSILLFSLPFCRNFWDYTWLFKLYSSTMSSYPYATVNAFNFWALLGKNWVELSSFTHTFINGIVISLTTLCCGILVKKAKNQGQIWLSCLFMIFTLFLFCTKMHERYLYPALILCFLSYVEIKDHRLLWITAGITVLQTMNVTLILNTLGEFLLGFYLPVQFLSFCLCLLYIFFLKTLYDIGIKNKIVQRNKRTPRLRDSWNIKRGKMGFVDFGILLGLTLFYGVFAFSNLGSTSFPTTFWQPTQVNDSFVLRLESYKTFDSIYFMTGVGDSTVNESYHQVGSKLCFEGSNNLEDWTEILVTEDQHVYDWTLYSVEGSWQYVRITALSQESVIQEVAFKEKGTDQFIPVSVYRASSHSNPNNPECAIDEQALIPLSPTYYETSIFDEIYHVRTAYEMIKNYPHYEWTHPPLGKIMISLGIRIFGLNPFGWRFMGTLLGVLMVPIFFCLLWELWNRRSLAIAGTLMFSFDFMHFTQTRLATIDTYAVFFILLMYLFMLKYLKCNFYGDKKKIMVSLGLCGLFMGLGWASKWTVIYASVGLALLFFAHLAFHYREYAIAKKMKKNNQSSETQEIVIKEFKSRTIFVLLFCCVFFVVVPVLIYIASYIPFFNIIQERNGLKEFFEVQQRMFNYHYYLEGEHFFSSKWYEWPLLVKPIWYDISILKNGRVSSISAFGNPLLWWGSCFTLILTVILGIKKKDWKAAFILVAYLSSYLPWVLVPRLTFIYHYFTAVPFAICSIVYCFNELMKKNKKGIVLLILFTAFAFCLFLYFYPVLSGVPARIEKIQSLEWFSSWYFVN